MLFFYILDNGEKKNINSSGILFVDYECFKYLTAFYVVHVCNSVDNSCCINLGRKDSFLRSDSQNWTLPPQYSLKTVLCVDI